MAATTWGLIFVGIGLAVCIIDYILICATNIKLGFALFAIVVGAMLLPVGVVLIANDDHTTHIKVTTATYYAINLTGNDKCELSDKVDRMVNIYHVSIENGGKYDGITDFGLGEEISTIILYFEDGTKNEDWIGDQFFRLLNFKDNVFKSSYDAKAALCKQQGGLWSDKLYQCLECQ